MSVRWIMAALLALAVAACSESDAGLGVLAVPAVGDTNAAELADGHPVFVVHDLDGTVYVIDAISPHIAMDQMAWCPTSRTIDDVFHGARWDAQGRYVSGPGPTDLGRYTFEVADAGTSMIVQEYVEPAPRSTVSDGMAGPSCVDGGYQVHPFHADASELWPTDDAWKQFTSYVGSPPPLLLDQADEEEWISRAKKFGLDHCASLRLGGPSRYSEKYAIEKEAEWYATGEPQDGPAGPAQTEILYEQLAHEAAELFICPTLLDK